MCASKCKDIAPVTETENSASATVSAKTRLCLLAEKYGCDKTPAIFHHYTPFYDQLFWDMPVRRVLEVGILHGASLRMWRDYFPAAQIFGLEINPDVLFQEERIWTAECDATIEEQSRRLAGDFGGDFDLIIEDGSHEPFDQLRVFSNLFPFLAPTGLYVIEDVAHPGLVSLGIHEPHLTVRTGAEPHDDCLILIPGTRRT